MWWTQCKNNLKNIGFAFNIIHVPVACFKFLRLVTGTLSRAVYFVLNCVDLTRKHVHSGPLSLG